MTQHIINKPIEKEIGMTQQHIEVQKHTPIGEEKDMTQRHSTDKETQMTQQPINSGTDNHTEEEMAMTQVEHHIKTPIGKEKDLAHQNINKRIYNHIVKETDMQKSESVKESLPVTAGELIDLGCKIAFRLEPMILNPTQGNTPADMAFSDKMVDASNAIDVLVHSMDWASGKDTREMVPATKKDLMQMANRLRKEADVVLTKPCGFTSEATTLAEKKLTAANLLYAAVKSWLAMECLNLQSGIVSTPCSPQTLRDMRIEKDMDLMNHQVLNPNVDAVTLSGRGAILDMGYRLIGMALRVELRNPQDISKWQSKMVEKRWAAADRLLDLVNDDGLKAVDYCELPPVTIEEMRQMRDRLHDEVEAVMKGQQEPNKADSDLAIKKIKACLALGVVITATLERKKDKLQLQIALRNHQAKIKERLSFGDIEGVKRMLVQSIR